MQPLLSQRTQEVDVYEPYFVVGTGRRGEGEAERFRQTREGGVTVHLGEQPKCQQLTIDP